MKADIYLDVVCPWCYIGQRRFARAVETAPGRPTVTPVYRSFQLDPDAPNEPVPLLDWLNLKFATRTRDMTARVTKYAAEEGVTIHWDRALAVNTFTAHRVLHLARTEYDSRAQAALVDALFAAHFTAGLNVADHDVLASLGDAAGMNRHRVRDYLANGEGIDAVRSALEEARQTGVTAVPTFVFEDRFAVEGAQSVNAFHAVFARLSTVDADKRAG
jgi:predicted DsbA family dithiol-disulfide isomerase